MKLFDRLHWAYPSLDPFVAVHWVPEQLNIKVVTGACKLIDGCMPKAVFGHYLQWDHLAHATGIRVNAVELTLFRDGICHKIVSVTTYIYLWPNTCAIAAKRTLRWRSTLHCGISSQPLSYTVGKQPSNKWLIVKKREVRMMIKVELWCQVKEYTVLS